MLNRGWPQDHSLLFTMKKLLIVLLFPLLALSCAKSHPLEDRAKKQIALSTDLYLEGYFPRNEGWSMEGLETVYVNDSICVLQCTVRLRDSLSRPVVRDYRYVYLLDMELSRAVRKPVFTESYYNVLCLSEAEIQDLRRDVARTGENVYDYFYGGCIPVQHPFDQ